MDSSRSCTIMRLLSAFLLFVVATSCQSCLMPSVVGLHKEPNHAWISSRNVALATTVSGVAASAVRRLQHPVVRKSLGGVALGVIAVTVFHQISPLLRSDDDVDLEEKGSEGSTEKEKPSMTTAMVASIGVYKNFISPLLPPACRFLPTCSSYGIQAIEEFGPTKGAILTAWRILRCSPLGGRGYDPPRWPPVSYTYASY